MKRLATPAVVAIALSFALALPASGQRDYGRATDPFYEGPDVQGRYDTDVVDDRQPLFDANRLHAHGVTGDPGFWDFYGYFEDAYDDDDWYYDYHVYDFDDPDYDGRDYRVDEHGEISRARGAARLRWFGGYDAAGEAALLEW